MMTNPVLDHKFLRRKFTKRRKRNETKDRLYRIGLLIVLSMLLAACAKTGGEAPATTTKDTSSLAAVLTQSSWTPALLPTANHSA
jgi:hypothetical protein